VQVAQYVRITDMAIGLIRSVEVPEGPHDFIFRSSRLRAVLMVLVCLGACAALLFVRWPHPRVAYIAGCAIALGLLLARGMIGARFRPSNWLIRVADEGLYIQFRSYLNYHLCRDDPTVVFLPYSDIRSARMVRERALNRDLQGHTQTETHRYVEFDLAVDPTPLAAALAAECARPGAPEKRWYGSSTTLYRAYPVLMQNPPFLRVEWRVVPGVAVFFEALKSRVMIAEAVSIREDFAHLQSLPRDQQERRLHDLDQRGQTIAAVYMARRLFGLDLTAATKFVDDLRGELKS
jgi:hypothetical protein